MDPHSGKPDSEESGVEKDYEALEETLRKLPPDRQEALQDWIDEQEGKEADSR